MRLVSRRQGRVAPRSPAFSSWLLWCALTFSVLFAQAIGAWHSVAHAAPPGTINVAVSAPDVASVDAQLARSADKSWLDALFAHHLKGHGHADCLSLDHSTHAQGLPTVPTDIALLALLDSWQMPLLAPSALAHPLRAFNARAPPILA